MRRISAQYAQPGMVLSRDIYDNYGNVLIYQGTRLTLDNIEVLGRLGGGEIFIRDKRIDDVPVSSLIPSRIEGELARHLRDYLEAVRGTISNQSSSALQLSRLENALFSMVEQLFPVMMGEVNASGCYALKDYDFSHPVQVTQMALAMGRKLDYTEEQLRTLGLAAVLQNIGYIALPKGLMEEPTTLSTLELHEVHQHVQYGYQILKEYSTVRQDVIDIIYQHHEAWDGSGYPRNLKGENICMDARIISIADTYYALVSRRPHRPANKPNEAIEFIMAYSGELFDSKLVSLFTKIIQTYPTGVMVNLNTGESGLVVGAHHGMSSRPIVRVCFDKNQCELAKPFDLDLSEGAQQHRLITEVVEY
jgi:HD-GYP domain-containing protein (c-di-GMP phosphodiesterase class II)